MFARLSSKQPLQHRKPRGRHAARSPLQLDLFNVDQLAAESENTAVLLAQMQPSRQVDESGVNPVLEFKRTQPETEPHTWYAMAATISQMSDYVPTAKRRYLNRHFPSWVAKIKPLRKLSQELSASGVDSLGQVVLMTEDEILARTSVSERTLQALKDDLATVGLKLGMKAPSWTPSHARRSWPRFKALTQI